MGKSSVTPQKFLEDLWAARASLALIAAVDLDVFTLISQGNRTAEAVARALKAPPRGVQRLLEAVAGLGYLKKKGSRFELQPIADMFLVRTRHTYMGAFAEESLMTIPGWMELAKIIRTGQPAASVDTAAGREFFPRLVRSIFPLTYGSALALVNKLPKRSLKKIERVLDVAAGSAAWSLPFAQAIPQARVTVLDYPEVTPVARDFAQKFGVADRFDYIEGDLRQIDFGEKKYDVVILGHIIHVEGEKWGKKLIEKSYKALKPGGMLVIGEMIPNDDRTGPVFPLLFGLNMIVHTNEGDVFTMAEYRRWLKEAGFKSRKTVEVHSLSPVILATRK